MNGKRAKALRKLARLEMAEDPERNIVASPRSITTAFNSPNSKRAMHLQLKKAYKRMMKGEPK